MREIRAALIKCMENGTAKTGTALYRGYASYKQEEAPALYSGCYGLGSRDLQPEGLIAAVENMLPEGKKQKFFYLGIDFIRELGGPKEEIRQNDLLEAYPEVANLALKGSENPDLLPKEAITVRMHSVGGWGAITTGKNLAMTLFELLGFDIRANPKYGSEKKGQPTTYYLSAAPEPIRLNCEYHYVDVVLSPDPNVFLHSNPVYGLKKGDPSSFRAIWRVPNGCGLRSRCSTSVILSSRTSGSFLWMALKSRGKRPQIRNCSFVCRATHFRAPSSPPPR